MLDMEWRLLSLVLFDLVSVMAMIEKAKQCCRISGVADTCLYLHRQISAIVNVILIHLMSVSMIQVKYD